MMKKKGGYIFSKAYRLCFIISFLTMIAPLSMQAKVTGRCDNCHTMHNSQNGVPVAEDGPYEMLLTNTCVGCHSAADRTTAIDSTTGAPIVFNSANDGPDYGASYGGIKQGLAGGNFYWVYAGDDTKGHNVFSDNPDEALASGAPGNDHGTGGTCGTNSCHKNIYGINSSPYPGFNKRQGCTKCHMADSVNGANGFHHAGDEDPLIDSYPWYRFLKGHSDASSHGVSGIEDPNWQLYPSSSVHNEYLGKTGIEWSSMLYHNMSSFCCGCHGNFHQQISDNAWIRHPSDAVIQNSGEYANAFGAAGSGSGTYDPLAPVARPSLTSVLSTVTIGADIVMCLSCHRPHGSPYPDMLRWDYEAMQAGGAGTGGCFACHTEKDGL